MGRLYIPELGERLCLSEPWTFQVHMEHRNATLLAYMGVERESYWWAAKGSDPGPWPCTLAAGTVLVVDRIYIRNGAAGFSSVSFRTTLPVGKKQKAVRFWAKLGDVNEIAYEHRPEDQPWWFGLTKRLEGGATVELSARALGVTRAALGAEQVTVAPFAVATVAEITPDVRLLLVREGQRAVLLEPNADRGWAAWDEFHGCGKRLSDESKDYWGHRFWLGDVAGCVRTGAPEQGH